MIRFALILGLFVALALPGHAAEPRISMDAQDIPIRVALQLIARESGVNIASSDSVSGVVTVNLNNVPWRDALNAVARAKGLLVHERQGVIWVDTPTTTSPDGDGSVLETAMLPIRYHSADEIAKNITEARGNTGASGATVAETAGAFLSARGKLFADQRSNTLVVSDLPANIQRLRELIDKLDVPATQVLIEARIVVASERFSRELGPKFGITSANAHSALGGSLDATIPNLTAAAPTQRSLMTGLALAMPAGSAALSVLKAGALIDVELQAMQSNGLGQIISQPRIITTNQRAARIAQGREIGYVTLQNHSNSEPTPNVAFKEALLELEVTPTITPDGHVFLQVQLKKDELDGYLQTSVGDIPQINRRAVNTSVLLQDGQTLVVGGVQEVLEHGESTRVPWLGDLPGVGALFRKTRKKQDKGELLIFLTPRVIRPVETTS